MAAKRCNAQVLFANSADCEVVGHWPTKVLSGVCPACGSSISGTVLKPNRNYFPCPHCRASITLRIL